MRLVRGVTIDQAAAALVGVRESLDRLGSRPMDQEYLAWAEDAEVALRPVFAEPDLAARLFSARYWQIYAVEYDYERLDPHHPAPDPCGAERAAQAAYLDAVAVQLEALRELAARPGRILVYDTNTLMHFQPPGALPWTTLSGAVTVRLVVPLVVVDELDAKKYSGSPNMSSRAAAALRELDALLDGAVPGGAVPVAGRAGVSVEVLLDEDGHVRAGRADDEIIERAVLLGQLAGAPVTLVTADTGMRLRAQCAGLGTLRLDGRYGKDQPAG